MARYKNIEGVEKIEAIFERMPRKAAEKLTSALNQAGHEMVQAAKSLAPVHTGKLRDSITYRFIPEKKGVAVLIYVEENQSDPESAYYARWLEFGRVAQTRGERITNRSGRQRISGGSGAQVVPAQPFFWPAYWATKKKTIARIKRAMTAGAKEAVRGGR